MKPVNSKLNVVTSPHWKDGSSISRIQKLWLIALLPAIIASFYHFGIHSLRIIALCVAVSVIFDYLSYLFIPTKDITSNWSSVTLGVILSFLLPYDAPWWQIVVCCFIMIVIGKKMFGGLGAYSVHPALLSVAMVSVSWPSRFDYTGAMQNYNLGVKMIEPMRLIKTIGTNAEAAYSMLDLFLGKQVGGIANAMVAFLLVGGIFLILLRQITWHIPAAFLAGVLVFGWIMNLIDSNQFASPLYHLLAGGTVFGAFFLATEPTTSPVNTIPMLIYGFIGGILIILLRCFSIYSDGVVFSILLLNLSNPLLDKLTPKLRGLEEIQNA